MCVFIFFTFFFEIRFPQQIIDQSEPRISDTKLWVQLNGVKKNLRVLRKKFWRSTNGRYFLRLHNCNRNDCKYKRGKLLFNTEIKYLFHLKTYFHDLDTNCVKIVQIRSFFWFVFSCILSPSFTCEKNSFSFIILKWILNLLSTNSHRHFQILH